MGKFALSASAIVFAGALLAVSCQRPAEPAAAGPVPAYAPTATVKELMLSLVDPSADVVWNAVTTVMSREGVVETIPRTDEDWADTRMGALRLAEGANLLMMPGRMVGRPGEKSETPGVELEPEEMDALIAKDRAAWDARAKALHDVSLEALAAIDAKDPEKLFEIGERIEHSCEGCHSTFWYPNEQVPPVPGGELGLPPPPR